MHILRRSYGELLDVVVPAYGFEGIAGYQTIKSFLLSVRDAIRKGDIRRVPMGCMLMGPPGTGKTAIAQAFARECGYIFLVVRNLLNMFVGSSEANNERMLMALRELAPAIVLRDEVDEEDSGRQGYQGDSGVSGRIRRMWMQFLSDSTIRGRVFVISCTNRPDRLDAALKRSGRTDERIPMLMPDHQTRTQLFPVMIQRYQFPCAEHIDWGVHATETKNFSGADIEVIVRRAYDFAAQDGGIITGECVHHAIEDFIPSASQAEIARMTLLAIQETSSKRFLPHDWSEMVAEAKA